jgi:NAD-dependent SIR2 family protein deacetylase
MLTDVKCIKCGKIYEDKIIYNVEKEVILCEECGSICEIIPALNASFRLKYDNKKDKVSWGSEGYATSQYYKEQNKLCKNNIFPMPQKKMGGKSAK